MRITIIAAGKMKERHFAEAANEYLGRLKNYGEVTVNEIPDDTTANEKILQRLQHPTLAGAYKIALSVKGKRFTSEKLAQFIRKERDNARRMAFVIGGSEGLNDAVLSVCPLHLSFSDLTFPHRLFRIMLLEQIYRACKINANEKYHK
ncbi:MAG: 23S rRNA (pseudouridine(1915)-N(3))-methyltransferase RlmH [Defluviitaleaceae bacterium]|nr:23S rRNA (pseudouridine(1915)-N(3))-methyltransferase RlmH [Defluviitaleaceae bacterium]MCL2276249.1 23S rRNA (pseudouridine(1915)-N(3))-methyltransferase RlmH [Defluviitaleaceae bacterium]